MSENCVLHSDHIHLTSIRKLLKHQSISRKGTSADNASIESFHSSLNYQTFYLS
ncbi:hypothetical protein BSNT_10209 [Bacillus subtilis subsp. natto BEST195]|nr:hypothetical protein BSNT_10209 [Bacillus subtilis subsp. natto BEST195]